jgi:Ankyrin repeat
MGRVELMFRLRYSRSTMAPPPQISAFDAAIHTAAFQNDSAGVDQLLTDLAQWLGRSEPMDWPLDPQYHANGTFDTPLHAVCWCGDSPEGIYIIDRLLRAGIDINCQNRRGNTPLHTAASQSYGCASSDGSSPRLVAALLQRGADINCPNHLAETPLIATAKGIYFDAYAAASLRLLVEAGADRQYRDCDGKQAIDYLREIYQIWFDTTALATLSHQDFYTYWADRLEHDDFKIYDLPEYVPAELRTLTQSIKLITAVIAEQRPCTRPLRGC